MTLLGVNGNGKRNGWSYSHEKLKENIDNNKHVKNIRKKLMQQKLSKRLQNS
ncbi:MAG: hypothetical protein ACFE9Z_12155 [Promethearchaeota archaeon]